jgi:hypothetical protein
LLAPRPIPIPEDQASVFISSRGRVATYFSRLLRYAWVHGRLNLSMSGVTHKIYAISLNDTWTSNKITYKCSGPINLHRFHLTCRVK